MRERFSAAIKKARQTASLGLIGFFLSGCAEGVQQEVSPTQITPTPVTREFTPVPFADSTRLPDSTRVAQPTSTVEARPTVTAPVATAPVSEAPKPVENWAARFDGEGDYLVIKNSENFHLTGKITIEARILLEEDTFPPSPVRGGDVIITKGELAEFALYARKLGPGCGRRMGAVFNGTEFCADQEVPKGRVVNLKVTYDEGKATFFIDNQEVSSTTIKTTRLINDQPIMIGARSGALSQDCGCNIDRIVLSDDQGARRRWEFNGDLKDSVSGDDAITFGNVHLVQFSE